MSPVFVAYIEAVYYMKQVKLSKRLSALADYIDDGATVADIGTDHGFLPVYLVQTDSVKSVIASDISAASLSSARRTAADAGITDSILFMVTAGLDGISPSDVDTVVIAGMGGETILSILKDAPWTKSGTVKLILQPQSKIDLLSAFLYDNGYKMLETKYVTDRGKRYLVILSVGTGE